MPNRNNFKTDEEYREWYREYRKKNKEKFRKYNKEYTAHWRSENGYLKDRVRNTLNNHIRLGKIKRGNCEICGEVGAEGHHFDYSKPLEVIWLCPIHHKDMHRKK